MIKRYIILKNNIQFAQVDSMTEMYKLIEMSRQQYAKSIRGKNEFKFKNDNYKIEDKLKTNT
jgi:hypothetical protein